MEYIIIYYTTEQSPFTNARTKTFSDKDEAIAEWEKMWDDNTVDCILLKEERAIRTGADPYGVEAIRLSSNNTVVEGDPNAS